MESKIVRAHIYIKGRVQGVSFRWWMRKRAKARKLTGWVRNLDDGRVEVVVEGEKDKLIELIELTKKGSSFSKVDGVEVDWKDATNEFKNFEIMF